MQDDISSQTDAQSSQGVDVSSEIIHNLGCDSPEDKLELDVLAMFYSHAAKSYGRKTDGVHEATLTIKQIGGEEATSISGSAYQKFLQTRFAELEDSLIHLAAVSLACKTQVDDLKEKKFAENTDFFETQRILAENLQRRRSIDELHRQGVIRNKDLFAYNHHLRGADIDMQLRRNGLNEMLKKIIANRDTIKNQIDQQQTPESVNLVGKKRNLELLLEKKFNGGVLEPSEVVSFSDFLNSTTAKEEPQSTSENPSTKPLWKAATITKS